MRSPFALSVQTIGAGMIVAGGVVVAPSNRLVLGVNVTVALAGGDASGSVSGSDESADARRNRPTTVPKENPDGSGIPPR